MVSSATSDVSIEQRSLSLGKWANLFMTISGVVAAHISHSDALLIDGLYSGVNFLSAIVAGRVALSVARPSDRRHPFGYDAHEAIYVQYRSLLLIGIMAFASFGALIKILTYLRGGEIPELVFGPILIYIVVMIVLCFSLAAWHRYNWQLGNGRSEILITESRAAIVDGVISAGAGGGLLAAALLRDTPLASIVPIADSILVLILCACTSHGPIKMLLGSLRELAGNAADSQTAKKVEAATERLIADRPFEVQAVAVTKLGRSHFIVAYLHPEGVTTAHEVDQLRDDLQHAYEQTLGPAKTEIIITAEEPF